MERRMTVVQSIPPSSISPKRDAAAAHVPSPTPLLILCHHILSGLPCTRPCCGAQAPRRAIPVLRGECMGCEGVCGSSAGEFARGQGRK